MHEVGIAQALLARAQAAIPAGDSAQVTVLHLRLGALAGLSPAELEFGFEVAAAGTPFAGARLEIELLPAMIHCPHCQADATVSGNDLPQCPACGAFVSQFVQGKELQLVSLEVADEHQRN